MTGAFFLEVMLKLTFYVPVDSAEKVKEALFLKGAGKLGNYEACSFDSLGVGQFRPLKGASPAVGEVGVLEKISELRVEMVLNDHILHDVIATLKAIHPYETVAYDVVKCMDI